MYRKEQMKRTGYFYDIGDMDNGHRVHGHSNTLNEIKGIAELFVLRWINPENFVIEFDTAAKLIMLYDAKDPYGYVLGYWKHVQE